MLARTLTFRSTPPGPNFPIIAETREEIFIAGTNHNVDLFAAIAAGDLLLVFFSWRSNAATVAEPAGWTTKYNTVTAGSAGGALFAKVADGTEDGGVVNCLTSASRVGTAIVYRVTNWGGNIAHVEVSAEATASSTTPDPAALSPSWGALDTLWLAAAHVGDDDQTVTAAPADYDDLVDVNTGAGVNAGASIGVGSRFINTASQDPGAFTISATASWTAWTIGIRPL